MWYKFRCPPAKCRPLNRFCRSLCTQEGEKQQPAAMTRNCLHPRLAPKVWFSFWFGAKSSIFCKGGHQLLLQSSINPALGHHQTSISLSWWLLLIFALSFRGSSPSGDRPGWMHAVAFSLSLRASSSSSYLASGLGGCVPPSFQPSLFPRNLRASVFFLFFSFTGNANTSSISRIIWAII